MMKVAEMSNNFSFLLKLDKKLLFELANMAESNLYINTKLSAIFVRQLAEAFLEDIISDYNGMPLNEDINNNGKTNNDVFDKVGVLYYTSRIRKFRAQNEKNSDVNLEKIDDIFPKDFCSDDATIELPPGAMNNIIVQLENRVNRDNKRIEYIKRKNRDYQWDYVRHLGNAASHVKQIEANTAWLQPKYAENGLKFLYKAMRIYYDKNGYSRRINYDIEKSSYTSGEIFYVSQQTIKEYNTENNILPTFNEDLCYSLVPDYNTGHNTKPRYIKNKYYLIRKYMINNDNREFVNFLRHSQNAYLFLQSDAFTDQLARYNVLSNSDIDNGYYVVSYEFDSEPKELSRETFKELEIYKSKEKLCHLFLQMANGLYEMVQAHVYHRNLTHKSFRLCKVGSKNRCKVYIIDMELVKIVKGVETVQVLVRRQREIDKQLIPFKDNLCQYVGVSLEELEDEAQYETEVIRRLGGVYANILCPEHLEPVGKNNTYEKPATREEITAGSCSVKLNKIFNDVTLNELLTLIDNMQRMDIDKLDIVKTKLEDIING